MIAADLRPILREIHIATQAVGAACAQQPEGWRHEIVRMRLKIADGLSRMGVLVSGTSASPLLAAFRSALSQLRSVVAELQAAWPVVTLDPGSAEYQLAIERVRLNLEALETALTALERGSPGLRYVRAGG